MSLHILYILQLIHSLLEGHLGCLQDLVIMNKAAISLCVHVWYRHKISAHLGGYQGVRFLDEGMGYSFVFIFPFNLTCWTEILPIGQGSCLYHPVVPKLNMDSVVAINAYNSMIHGNLYHQFIAKCYHSLKCKFGEARC